MAGRPPKEGIDYAGWDVNIFDSVNGNEIDKLLEAQGCAGFVVYFFLCQRAYGSNGYYFPWTCDDATTTAKRIGGGVGSVTVIDTVNLCLRLGLFNRDLFDRHKILTSSGIQKRYKVAIAARTIKTVISDYWLLSKEESVGLDFRALSSNYDPTKLNYDPTKSALSPPIIPIKESKVNNNAFERVSIDDVFNATYALYPRKEGKAKGKQHYIGYLTNGREITGNGHVRLNHQQIYIAVQEYAEQCESTESRYIKQFDTFMGPSLLDYIERIKADYEAVMLEKYGEEWEMVRYEYV